MTQANELGMVTAVRVGNGLRICDSAVYLPDIISVFELGEICTREDPRARPDINMVLFKLTLLFRTSAEAGALNRTVVHGSFGLYNSCLHNIILYQFVLK